MSKDKMTVEKAIAIIYSGSFVKPTNSELKAIAVLLLQMDKELQERREFEADNLQCGTCVNCDEFDSESCIDCSINGYPNWKSRWEGEENIRDGGGDE